MSKLYGLLGRKLGHSWSAPLHKAFGCPGYRLVELEPEDLPAFLRREDIGGFNVMIPYKRTVMEFCDALSEEARAIGRVNTLVRKADGKLWGFNTDAAGFHFMAKRAGVSFAKRKVAILGSGGASLSVRYAAKALSRLTGREAVDIDAEIEKRAGKNVTEIFADGGEAAFREWERRVTAEASKQVGVILITSGGVVKDAENYAPLKQNGRIYHVVPRGTPPVTGGGYGCHGGGAQTFVRAFPGCCHKQQCRRGGRR